MLGSSGSHLPGAAGKRCVDHATQAVRREVEPHCSIQLRRQATLDHAGAETGRWKQLRRLFVPETCPCACYGSSVVYSREGLWSTLRGGSIAFDFSSLVGILIAAMALQPLLMGRWFSLKRVQAIRCNREGSRLSPDHDDPPAARTYHLACLPDVIPGPKCESGYFRSLSRRFGHGTEGEVDGGDHRLLA